MQSYDRGSVSRRPLRTVLAVGAALAALVLALRSAVGAGVPYINDFVAYWATGRLLLEGGNPYDAGALLELQRAVGSRFVDAGVVRNPPWVLPFLLPFAALPFAAGWYVWAICQILLVGVSAVLLWKLFGGRARPTKAILLTFLFPPALFVALGGQIGGLLLLGLAGFTWAVEQRRDFLAGLFLGLLTLKPHLLLPFGVVVLLWTFRERRFAPLLGAATVVAASCVLALLLQPDLFDYYAVFARAEIPEEDVVSTPGAALRLLFGFDRFWIQWLPAVIGIGWGVRRFHLWRDKWLWSEQLPLLAAVSWLSAPYGWVYDMVLLVPTVLDAAVHLERFANPGLSRRALTLFLLLGIVVWTQQLLAGSGVVHVWVGFAVLLFWMGIHRATEETSAVAGFEIESPGA